MTVPKAWSKSRWVSNRSSSPISSVRAPNTTPCITSVGRSFQFLHVNDVVRPVHVRPVVPRARRTGRRQTRLAPTELDLEKAFRERSIGEWRTPHGGQLHQMRFGPDIAHGVEQVQCGGDVIVLHKHGSSSPGCRLLASSPPSGIDEKVPLGHGCHHL
jgi:hypothetical protein